MRILIVTLGLFLLFSDCDAQMYRKYDNLLSAGVRFGTFNDEAPEYKFIPVNASLEHIFIDKWNNHKMAVGGGIETGYFTYTLGNNTCKVVQLSLLANVHYTFNRQFEVYAGIRPGYYFDSYANTANGEYTSADASSMDGFNNQIVFGARYYILPQLGIYTRMLIDDFGTEAGLTFKF